MATSLYNTQGTCNCYEDVQPYCFLICGKINNLSTRKVNDGTTSYKIIYSTENWSKI